MTAQTEQVRLRTTRLRLDLARYLPSAILVGYGIFILSLQVRGSMTLYINPSYVWPTCLAGLALIGLGAARLFRRTDAACGHDECCGADSCGCGEAPARIWPFVALLLPLLLAVAFPPQGLAAFSARQRGTQIAGLTAIQGAAPVNRVSLSVDTRSFTMQDWVGALSADPNPKDYAGKQVRIAGIVFHNPASVPPGYIMVIRYQVTCCIADARPVGLVVRDTSQGALQDNQWVTVDGRMTSANFNGQTLTVVAPKHIVKTKTGDPYMY